MPYYHVRIRVLTEDSWSGHDDWYEMDLSEDDAKLVGRQYYDGKRVLYKGKWIDSSEIEEVEIRKTPKRAEEYEGFFSEAHDNIFDTEGEDVTRRFLTASVRKTVKPSLGDEVFVVHGRNKQPALELVRILENRFGLTAILLQEQAHRGRTVIEQLEEHSDVQYAFVMVTPDDVGALEGEKLRHRARQNVILEFGLFAGKIGRKRMTILLEGDIELPSDMHGILYSRFHDSPEECFLEIERDLKAAGYDI